MRDPIVAGTVAGLIGGTIGILFSHTLFLLEASQKSSLHLAAALVVTDIFDLTIGGYIWSILMHLLFAAFFAILLVIIFTITGYDYWALKSIGFGALFCVASHSYLVPLLRTDINMKPDAASTGAMLVTHMLIGLISGYVLVRYYRPHLTTTKASQ